MRIRHQPIAESWAFTAPVFRRSNTEEAVLATGSLRASIRQSAVLRLLTLPVGVVAGLLAIRLVVGAEGDTGFAVYALIAGVVTLVPFADLGVGAAVTDAAARRLELGEEGLNRVLVTSIRTLVVAGSVMLAVAWVVAALGGWSPLLGLGASEDVDLAVALAISVFVLGLPASLGYRVLVGAGYNHIAVGLQGLTQAVALGFLGLFVINDAPVWLLPSAPGMGATVTAVVAAVWAQRLSLVSLFSLIASALTPSFAGQRIRQLALPMLIIQVSLPLTFQTDRLVLSWVTSLREVAQYSFVAPLYVALFSIVAATGGSMWAHFGARRREGPVAVRQMARLMGAFSLGGLLLAMMLILLGPAVVRFMTHDGTSVPLSVYATFGCLIWVHSLWLPLGMYFTDPSGLRFQAIGCSVMAVVNIAVGVALAAKWGAAGPPLASAVAIAVGLLIPGVNRYRRLARKTPTQ